MALNGGVSLAVWMGGCAVELDCARRAHVGHEQHPAAGQAVPDRSVYHALCAAFRRELVIDLMSGSSRRINGALLAAAIHSRGRLDPDYIRDQWMLLGGFGSLLRPPSEPEPTSLMNGVYFHGSLRRIFEELLERPKPAERAESLADDVKLDITTTDVEGEARRFRDEWGEDLVASEYRQRFEFRDRGDFTVTGSPPPPARRPPSRSPSSPGRWAESCCRSPPASARWWTVACSTTRRFAPSST